MRSPANGSIGTKAARASRGGRRPKRHAAVVVLVAAALALAGCDDAASGPGTLDASLELVSGGSPGAALLVVQGDGVTRVEGTGGTRSWGAPSPGGGNGIRVLLMDPDPDGAMTFEVDVEDLDAPRPSVTVFQLADRSNQRLSTSTEVRVTFEP